MANRNNFQPDNFFFEQSSRRGIPRRHKKTPEELPQELRFAHLNPRVAAYLTNKEKADAKDTESEFDDGLGKKSLLPQISQTFNMIRQHLDTADVSEEDAQRYIFDQAKLQAPMFLIQLAKLLYLFEGCKVHLPRSLEYALTCSYTDMITTAKYIHREWQLLANRDAAVMKEMAITEEALKERDEIPSIAPPELFDDSRSVRDSDSISVTQRRKKPHGQNKHLLADVVESEEHPMKHDVKYTDSERTVTINKDRPVLAHRSSSRLKDKSSPRHLESVKSNISEASFNKASRKNRDDISMIAESEDAKSVLDKTGYWAVIQFALSNKACDDRGWIVHPAAKNEEEKHGLLEWVVQKLRLAIKLRKEQEETDRSLFQDKPVLIRYYGDSRKEMLAKYKKVPRVPTVLDKDQRPTIPPESQLDGKKKVFMYSINDGSSTTYYPSGRIAVVCSSSGERRPGFYTLVYDDNDNRTLRACFTPTGKGCTYHENGVVDFLSTSEEGTLSDEGGLVTKRWKWPPKKARLPATMNVQINQCANLKITSQHQMVLVFTCEKETFKVNVGANPEAEEPTTRDQLGLLQSSVTFVSNTAKEMAKPAKPKPSKKRGRKFPGALTMKALFAMSEGTSSSNTPRKYGTDSPNNLSTKPNDTPSTPSSDKLRGGSGSATSTPTLLTRVSEVSSATGLFALKQHNSEMGASAPAKSLRRLLSESAIKVVAKKDSPKTPPSAPVNTLKLMVADSPFALSASGEKGKPHVQEIQKIASEMPEEYENDASADKELHRLETKFRNMAESWLEHYRIALGVDSPQLGLMKDRPRGWARLAQSARAGMSNMLVNDVTGHLIVPNAAKRVPSAPAGRPLSRGISASSKDSMTKGGTATVKFDDSPEAIEVEAFSPIPTGTPSVLSGPSSGEVRLRAQSAPQRTVNSAPSDWLLLVGDCPLALRLLMLGEDKPHCKCTRYKIPFITDIEYDEFINRFSPSRQLTVVAIVNSLFPDASSAEMMLETLHTEKNKNRTRPCLQCRSDAYRLLFYDIATAAAFSNYTQPLLLRRHNVVPGMFLIYDGGKLVFCDHIFNGYGNARKDFQKQIMKTRHTASQERYLPKDFRFSPQKGRHGPRAAWGGEIGGTGVDRHGSAGLPYDSVGIKIKRSSSSSLSSSKSSDRILESTIGALGNSSSSTAAKYISLNLAGKGFVVPPIDIGMDGACMESSLSLQRSHTEPPLSLPRLSPRGGGTLRVQ